MRVDGRTGRGAACIGRCLRGQYTRGIVRNGRVWGRGDREENRRSSVLGTWAGRASSPARPSCVESILPPSSRSPSPYFLSFFYLFPSIDSGLGSKVRSALSASPHFEVSAFASPPQTLAPEETADDEKADEDGENEREGEDEGGTVLAGIRFLKPSRWQGFFESGQVGSVEVGDLV